MSEHSPKSINRKAVSRLRNYHERPINVEYEDYELHLPLWEKPNSANDFTLLPCPILDPKTIQPVWDPITDRHLVTFDLDLANKSFLQSVVNQVAAIQKINLRISPIPVDFVKFLLNKQILDSEIDPWLECRERWTPVSTEKPIYTAELECPTKEAAIFLARRMREDPPRFADRWQIKFAVASLTYDAEPSQVRIEGQDLTNTRIFRAIEKAEIDYRGRLFMQLHDIETWAYQCAERIAVRMLESDGILVDSDERRDIRKRVFTVLSSRSVDYPTTFNGDWSKVFWGKRYFRPDFVCGFLNSRVKSVEYHSGVAPCYRTLPRVNENSMEGQLLTEMSFLSGPNAQYEDKTIVFTENQVMKFFLNAGSPVYYSRNYRKFFIDDFTLYDIDLNHLSRILIAPRWTRRRRLTITESSPIIGLPSYPMESELSRRGSMHNLNVIKDDPTVQTAQVLSLPKTSAVVRRWLTQSPTMKQTEILLHSPKSPVFEQPPIYDNVTIPQFPIAKAYTPPVATVTPEWQKQGVQTGEHKPVFIRRKPKHLPLRTSSPIDQSRPSNAALQKNVRISDEQSPNLAIGPAGSTPEKQKPVQISLPSVNRLPQKKTIRDEPLPEMQMQPVVRDNTSPRKQAQMPTKAPGTEASKPVIAVEKTVYKPPVQPQKEIQPRKPEKVREREKDYRKSSHKIPRRHERRPRNERSHYRRPRFDDTSSEGTTETGFDSISSRSERKDDSRRDRVNADFHDREKSPEKVRTKPYRHSAAQRTSDTEIAGSNQFENQDWQKSSKQVENRFWPHSSFPSEIEGKEPPLLSVATVIQSTTKATTQVQTYISYGQPEPDTGTETNLRGNDKRLKDKESVKIGRAIETESDQGSQEVLAQKIIPKREGKAQRKNDSIDSFLQEIDSWPTNVFDYSSTHADEVFTPGTKQSSAFPKQEANGNVRNSMQIMEELEPIDDVIGEEGNHMGSMNLLETIPEIRNSMRHLEVLDL